MRQLSSRSRIRRMANLVDKRCESVEWWTPERVLEPIRKYFNGIVLDPATAPSNPTGAEYFFTREDSGLLRGWDDGTFLNPPYGPEMKEWLAKLKKESLEGWEIICLLPASRWEQQYLQECAFNQSLSGMCLIRKRLQFIDGTKGETCKSNPYASILYGYNLSQWDLFKDCFSSLGTVLKIGEILVHDEINE